MVRTVGGPNHFGLVRTAFPGSNHENLVHPYFFRLLRRVVMYLVRLATFPHEANMANANFRLRRALFTLHGIICATHFHIFGSGERHPTDPGTPERTGGQQEDSPAHMWKPRPERRAEAGTRSYNNCSPSCSHAHIPRTPASDARARSSGKQPSLAAVPQPHTFHTGVEYRWRSCWTPKCLR